MAKLLYIEASPRKKRSSSIAVAQEFLDEYRKMHPQDEVILCDLWQKEMPPFDGETIDAKYAIMHKQPFTPEQEAAWKRVETIITEFKAADKYVISLPMWNYGIPYRLKHYIDILVQPGYTFSFSPKTGYQGLVTGKPMALIYSRGGAYGAETGVQDLDLQTRYMQTILGFIGFTDFRSILIEPTLAGSQEQKEQVVTLAKDAARLAAKQF